MRRSSTTTRTDKTVGSSGLGKSNQEFGKAAAIRPDRKDVQAAADNAAAQLEAQRNQQAANAAVLESDEYAQKNQLSRPITYSPTCLRNSAPW
jgi:hypothetical protein